ncbi:hypothetical protein LP419_35220 [Massilia sp. H-1]|nr:hypothetical protein LP419_35220 [Massilia sp. H-1]
MTHAVLVISDQLRDSSILRQALALRGEMPFAVVPVRNLHDALRRLDAAAVDIILLTLDLPDSTGLATFERVQAAALSHADRDPVRHAGRVRSHGRHAARRPGLFSTRNIDDGLVAQALRSMICRKSVEEALHLEKKKAASCSKRSARRCWARICAAASVT